MAAGGYTEAICLLFMTLCRAKTGAAPKMSSQWQLEELATRLSPFARFDHSRWALENSFYRGTIGAARTPVGFTHCRRTRG